MRSASVDLPWSMWAMIEKLRMCAWSAMRAAIQDRRRRGAGAGGPTAAAPRARSADRRAGRQRLVVGQRDAVAAGGPERLGPGFDGQQRGELVAADAEEAVATA